MPARVTGPGPPVKAERSWRPPQRSRISGCPTESNPGTALLTQVLGLARHHEGELSGLQTLFRDAIHVLEGYSVDPVVAGINIISGQPFHLHEHSNVRDRTITVEPQWIGAGQVSLGILQFLCGHALVPD